MSKTRCASAVLAAIAAVAVAAVDAGCGGSSPTPAGQARDNLGSIIEDEAVLHANPAAAVRTFARLGVDRVRVFIPWAAIAPDATSSATPDGDLADPSSYPTANWSLYDDIIRSAAAAHMPLLVTVGAPAPRWALGSDPQTVVAHGSWKPSPSEFGEFIRALGTRYDGHYTPTRASSPLPRVNFWEIWNEPNYGQYLAPQAVGPSQVNVGPRLYRGLVDAAWAALAATGHGPGSDTILIGSTAPRGNVPSTRLPGDGGGMYPLRFIRSLYCVGENLEPLSGATAAAQGCPRTAAASHAFKADNPGLFAATGFSDHPYPDLLPPTIRTPAPAGADFADFAALPNLETTLDGAFRAYGLGRRIPIYSTEFGYVSVPSMQGLPYVKVAAYLNEAEYLSWLNPRIRSYDQYQLVDAVPSAENDFLTGLETSNGTPKPDVYDSYVMPLWLPRTTGGANQPLTVWGCARPAPRVAATTGQTQQVAIQFARRGGTFRTLGHVTLDPGRGGCYFTAQVRFPASGSVRLAWAGGGLADVSRVQTITLR